MKIMTMTALAVLTCFAASAAFASHAYIDFDADGNMVLSGLFDAIIPKPDGARIGAPENSTVSFMGEDLKVSMAGYFADEQFVIVQIETTNAPAGTLSNENLPIYELAGREFRARTVCVDISQEELDADDDPLFEFVEQHAVQIVPAAQVVQLFVTADDGTAEGVILYVRNVPDGCDALTQEFETEFHSAFERFIESIRSAN